MTIVRSLEYGRIFGAFTITSNDHKVADSYMYSLDDVGDFEKLNYKLINQDQTSAHPANLFILQSDISLIQSAPTPDDQTTPTAFKTKQTKLTQSTQEPSAKEMQGDPYLYLSGSKDFKIDVIEIW